jgi:hypothetical protein
MPSYLARVTYPSVGTTQNFAVPFPYLSEDHVEVFKVPVGTDPETVTALIVGVDYTWTSASVIHLTAAPTANPSVLLRRTTPSDGLLERLTSPGPVLAAELNALATQLLYISQEANDQALASDADLSSRALLVGFNETALPVDDLAGITDGRVLAVVNNRITPIENDAAGSLTYAERAETAQGLSEDARDIANAAAVDSENQANLASALYAQFKALFLGAFVDDTAATLAATLGLTDGMLYVNTTTGKLRIYSTGGDWADYDVTAQAAVTLAATYGNMTAYKDYATLAAVTPAAGTMGVVYYDAGTHTDPVTSTLGTSNSGIFAYSTSAAGWQWLGPTVSGNLASLISSLLAAQAIPVVSPTQIGSTAGAVNPGSVTFSWGNTEPVKVAGLLTKFQWNMSAGSTTVSILFYDPLTMKVLKIFAGVAASAGVNTLAAGTINNWSCPEGALAMVVITAGSGQLLQATGATRPAVRVSTSNLTSLVVGSTMPALGSIASTQVDILLETTPTNAQGVSTRLALIETNEAAEDGVFVGRQPYTTRRNVGVTTLNAAATSAVSASRIYLTPALTHGGKAVSAFVNLNAPGSGFLLFLRQTDDLPTYSLWKAVPAGPLAAGANTIALPEMDLPAGTVMGYYGVVGGLLNSIGNVARQAQYISTAGFTGVVGSTYTTTTAANYGEIGLVVLGASDRWQVSGTKGDVRKADNQFNHKPRYPKTFIKGVWLQPASLAATWQARGVDTMYTEYADFADGDGANWIATVVGLGMNYVRRPGTYALEQATAKGLIISAAQAAQVQADCEYDAVQPLCIGWHSKGEPDGGTTREEASFAVTTASPFYTEREIARWRSIYHPKPVFIGVQGFHVIFPGTSIRSFMNLRDIDVFGFDIYPNDRGAGGAGCLWEQVWTTDSTHRDWFTTVNGACCEYLSQMLAPAYATQGPTRSGGLPTFAAIATSRVESPRVPPTPGEFRCLCWSAVVGGVIGVQYFPQDVTVGSYASDASDANVITEMQTFHANLAVMQAAGCLMDSLNGGRIPFQKRLSVPIVRTLDTGVPGTWPVDTVTGSASVFQTPAGMQMAGGFEGIRVVGNNGVAYYLLVNLVGVANTLTDALWGITALAFTAYEVKFVAASAPTVNLFSSSGL